MILKKSKLLLCFMILSTVVLLAACGKKNETEPETIVSHEGIKPPSDFVRNNYNDITKIMFQETFAPYKGVRVIVEVIITNTTITYSYMQDFPNELETVENVWEKPFNETEWEKMKRLLLDNQVGLWEYQLAYQNLLYRDDHPLDYKENRDADYRTQGQFFNIASPFRYLGIDENEKAYRSGYEGGISIATNEEAEHYWGEIYRGYGLPPTYNQYADELWDYVIGYTGGKDWREELDSAGIEGMRLVYPYMEPDETAEPRIRYFSLLESYGGKDAAVPILFVYDGGAPSFTYECLWGQKTYSMNEEGQPILYCDDPRFSISSREMMGKSYAYIQEGNPGVDMLEMLVDDYGVSGWSDQTSGKDGGYVEQGEFYNADNAKEVSDENQKRLRERYDALIHVVYSNGEHKEIRLENGKLPESYNQFRKELWDYFIPYIYRKEYQDIKELYEQGKDGGEEYPRYNVYFIQEYMENEILGGYWEVEELGWEAYLEQEDWRNHIDDWGKEYMLQKYPYMAPTSEQESE